jgi:glycosyltransferase involved in cell wall biosynthesis
VIEALACGAPVIASEIPSLREAGGAAVDLAPVADVGAWSQVAAKLLTDPAAAPPRSDRLAWASGFTWTAHAEIVARTYNQLLST